MKKIWITGASGHIGTALMKFLDCTKYRIHATDISEVDITKLEEVQNYMNICRPDVVINCAGMTDVKECEKNVDEAYRVNAIGVRNIAVAAQAMDAKLIQVSTDDVFDLKSDHPYNEFDRAYPKTVYGKSKYAGEQLAFQLMNQCVIIRSSWVYGIGRDFVSEVLGNVGTVDKMEVPNNRYAVPTSAQELAKVIVQFIDSDECGIYHAVCKGSCSRYEFAKEILKIAGKSSEMEIVPVLSEDNSRPEYSVLDNMMIHISGLREPKDWKAALKEYIEETGGIE